MKKRGDARIGHLLCIHCIVTASTSTYSGTDCLGIRDGGVIRDILDRCVCVHITRPVGNIDIGILEHAVGTGVGEGLAHPVATDADDEGEYHGSHGSDDGAGGSVGAEESATTEDRAGDQETVGSGVPVTSGIVSVVDLTGEDLVATLPHGGGTDGEAGDQRGGDDRRKHVEIKHGVDRIIGGDGAEGEEAQDTRDDPSSRVVDDVAVSAAVVVGVHCQTFLLLPARSFKEWPAWLMARNAQAQGLLRQWWWESLPILKNWPVARPDNIGQLGDQGGRQDFGVKGLDGVFPCVSGHLQTAVGIPGQAEHRFAESLNCLVLKQYPGIFRNQFWQQSAPTGDDGNTAAEGFPGRAAGSIGSGHEEYQHVETAQMLRVGVRIDITGKTNPVAEPGQCRRSASHLILMRATAENLEA